MDIGKSFTFVFEDEDWIVKILIAAAIALVGVLFSWLLLIPLILAFALLAGYGVEITRRVIHGSARVLPEWDNWGNLIADGLKALVVVVVYALPIIVMGLCLAIPLGVIGEESESLSTVLGLCLGCVNLLWAIAMSLLLPAALAMWVADDDLSAAFRFGEVFALVRDNVSTYLIAFLMSWVANFVGELGSIVCGIGWLVTFPYSIMVTGHLYGQAYLQAKGQLTAPVHDDLFDEPLDDVEIE